MLSGPEVTPRSGRKPKKLAIILHGLGANGDNLIDIARVMNRFIPDIHFIAPNAPEPYDFQPYGYYQWFSVADRAPEKMIAGARKAEIVLNEFIDHQLQRFNLEEKDLIVMGFSQGAMMSLHTCLRRKNPVALVIGFSGSLLSPELLHSEIKSKPDVLLLHGTDDEVVPVSKIYEAEKYLKENHVPVKAFTYNNIGHSISEEGFKIALDTIKKKLGIDI
jgi:phospholipase/carboxylesterase